MMISTVIAFLLLPVAIFWLSPLVSEGMTLLAAHGRPGGGNSGKGAAQPDPMRLAFLVPAHNEEFMVEGCIAALLAQHSETSDTQIFLIADNCSDGTAQLAREAGAQVLERFNEARPGKPAAIQWGMGQINLSAFDAVVIVDADTRVDPGFADALAQRGPLRDKAVQAYNGIFNEADSWLSRLAGLLGRIRYEGQYAQKIRAGLNCPLTGNGMCLGTDLLQRAGWAPTSLTENWELYARYTTRGETIDFAPEAWVGAREAPTLAHSVPQRRRWQAGRRGVLFENWRTILGSPNIGPHQKLDLLAELSIPGPALHATLAGTLALFLLVLPGSVTNIVAALFLLSLLPMVTWTLITWARHPEPGRVALAFAGLPVYGVWRVVVALLAIGTGRRRIWVRSPRPDSAQDVDRRRKSPAA